MTSPDGITWTERVTPAFTGCDVATGLSGVCNQWSGLAYGNTTWIAVSTDDVNGNKQIMKSTDDGATWTYVTGHTSRSWQDILFVNNTFIAMSRGSVNDHALVSTDNGATWSLRRTRLGGGFELATDGTTITNVMSNGAGIQTDYVALSTLMAACVSSNCWTDNSTIFFPSPNWTELVYAAGIFLMVGQQGTNRVAYTTTSYTPTREREVITIDPNDGASEIGYQSGSSTQALVLPTPTRSGYTLTGWNTKKDGSGTPYANGDNYPFSTSSTEATTLFAQWTVAATTTTTSPTTTTIARSTTTSVAQMTTTARPSGGSGTSGGGSTAGNLPGTGFDSGLFVNLTVAFMVAGATLVARRRLVVRV